MWANSARLQVQLNSAWLYLSNKFSQNLILASFSDGAARELLMTHELLD